MLLSLRGTLLSFPCTLLSLDGTLTGFAGRKLLLLLSE